MRIEYFKQTPFISYDEKNLVKVKIGDWDACNPYHVQILVDGREEFSKFISTDTFDALVPVSQKEQVCNVVITPYEDIPVRKTFMIKMPKQWKVSILYSSHEDLGYCAYIDKLDYEFYTYLLKAMSLCERLPGFRYVIEHYEWLRSFERYATEEERALLKELFKQRKIELNAIPCGVHTHWAEASQLIENAKLSTDISAKKWEMPVQTAIYADISGLSVQCVSAYANQGIRYVGVLYNRYRRQNYAGEIPLISRWYAPNGKDSVLLWNAWAYRCAPLRVWCGSKRFDHSEFYFDETKSIQTEHAISEMIENLGNVPYSTYPVSYYDDHEVPTEFLVTVCDYMNKKWKYPKFAMEVPSVFLGEIEKQGGDALPVLTGDLTDQWADFINISPEWVSVKRDAMRKKYQATLLDTMSAIKENKPYPESVYREVSRLGAVFDEHCWASSSKHPLKMHIYNAYQVKKLSADKSLQLISERISSHLGKPQDKIGIYNLLPQDRLGTLKLSIDQPIPSGIKCQRLPDGKVITEPIKLSAMSCKNVDVCWQEIKQSQTTGYAFETQFYSVIVNKDTCQIESVVDKTTNQELLDADSQFGFGEYVYTVADGGQSPNLYYEWPKENQIRVEEGEVAFVVYKTSYEEQSGADIYTAFIFYKNDRTIDVDIKYENAKALMGDYYDRYKKNIFFAFPFNVKNPIFYTQLAGGGAHSEKQKIQCAPLDFSVAENWVSVEGDELGIGLLSKDMPIFHFGDINLHKFMPRAEYHSSHLYLHGASNKMNSLNYTKVEHCCGRFEISILPYQNGWQNNLQKWSLDKLYQPILAKPSEQELNGITIDKEVRLISVQPSERQTNAIMVTLSEVNGRDEKKVQMSLPFKPSKACYTDINGKVIKSAEIDGNKVIFDVDALSYTVLLIEGDFSIKKASIPTDDIFDIITVEINNHDSIVSFEKSPKLKAKGFKIYGDGKLLKEIENSKLLIERVELKGRYKDVKIEIVK